MMYDVILLKKEEIDGVVVRRDFARMPVTDDKVYDLLAEGYKIIYFVDWDFPQKDVEKKIKELVGRDEL